MSASKLSPYANTPVTDSGFLDIFAPVPIPVAANDILYEILPAYTFRPDLLAFDLYGQRELWWVFAQRNLDVLKDPIFDFKAGTQIFLPQGSNLREIIGF